MRGVSPLFAAALLAAIAVAVSAIVGGWLSGFSQETSSTIRNSTETQLSCQFADVFIRNATYNCSRDCSAGIAHNLTLSIVNSGKTKLIIEEVSIENTTGGLFLLDIPDVAMPAASTAIIGNVSIATCNGINHSIGKIIITSPTCPNTAYDSLPGSQVNYLGC